jgi:hypothetical protein
MPAFHQMGHNTSNMIECDEAKSFGGAILSPVNEDENAMSVQIARCAAVNHNVIFDPQLYYPTSDRGKLTNWRYYPSDVDTADHSKPNWWKTICTDLAETCEILGVDSIASPAIVPRAYSESYYGVVCDVFNELVDQVGEASREVIPTILAKPEDLSDGTRGAFLASLVSGLDCKRCYVVFVTGVDPRRELAQRDDLLGCMNFIRDLESAGVRVVVGFTSTDVVLWRAAGATACATGKFFNLRRFTPGRFEEPSGGGGQLPYWTEHSLLAFLRESDLIRVRKSMGLSRVSSVSPAAMQILKKLDRGVGEAWVADGWRQYLAWFGLIASRENPLAAARQDVATAIASWQSVHKPMEERANDGKWLSVWKDALDRFEP